MPSIYVSLMLYIFCFITEVLYYDLIKVISLLFATKSKIQISVKFLNLI